MKKTTLLIFLGVILLSNVSAEIIFNEEPEDIYNLGDIMPVSATIKATKDIPGHFFYTQLLCDGNIKSLSQIPVTLETGQEKNIEFNLKLNKDTIGALRGECAIKGFLQGEESISTKEFKISESISLQSKVEQIEFNPGEGMIAKGEAFKENGKEVNGFIALTLIA